MSEIEKITEEQITFLVGAGSARKPLTYLSAYTAWELMDLVLADRRRAEEKKQTPRTKLKPFVPKPPSKLPPARRTKPKPARRKKDLRHRIVTFGKHKGKYIDDVPTDYLEWMVREFDDGNAWKAKAAWLLQGRKKEDRRKRRVRVGTDGSELRVKEFATYRTILNHKGEAIRHETTVTVDPTLLSPWEDEVFAA